MSKLGDLIVRMRLQYDDYKKGLKNATVETKGFAGTLGKIKGVGLAVWGAIGASVISFANQLIKSSNAIGDAWNRTTAQMKAGWDVFVQSVASMNWNNFIGRIKEATRAAKELTDTLDSEFEVSNSIKLQKSAMAQQLAELEILARDQTKTYKERAEAAKKYLDMVKPLYDQELKLAQRLEDAQLGKWLAGSGITDSEQTRKDLRNFLVAYGKDDNLVSALTAMRKMQSDYDIAASTMFRTGNFTNPSSIITEYRAFRDYVKDYEKNHGYGTDIYALAQVYEKMRGDADTEPLVNAMIAAGEAAGAFDRETKRMQSALNTSLAQIDKEGADNGVDSFATLLNMDLAEGIAEAERQVSMLENVLDVDIEGPEMDLSALDAADAQIKQFVENWNAEQEEIDRLNGMIESSIVNSIGNGMEAFTDMLFGLEGADAGNILAALMQPFANTAAQLGSMLIAQGIAVEAFKESLDKLQGIPAIAAGTALLAISSAMKSGIRSLAGGGAGAGTSYGGGSYGGASDTVHYDSTLTVIVEGKISGGDIILASKKTQNKWDR